MVLGKCRGGEGNEAVALKNKRIARNHLLHQLPFGKVPLHLDPDEYRPTEVDLLIGDPTKSKTQLGWKPAYDLADLVKEMVANDVEIASSRSMPKEVGHTF